jgi:hypothetical protein
MAIAYKLGALFLFCLKAFFLLLFFFVFWATYAKCSHDGSNDVYAGTQFDTRDDMSIYARYDSYAERYH